MHRLLQSTSLVAFLSFVLGGATFAILPRAWLFIEEAPGTHPDVDKPREVWACPMLCVRLDGPGTCPVCGMDLEQLKDTGDVLTLNERERRLIDLQTVPVTRQVLNHSIRTFGQVDFNQRRVERISAWVSGRITRLYADTRHTEVREGDHLFEIYSPELFAAQSEYLAARSAGGGLGRRLVASSREKLLLYGLTQAQLTALERSGRPQHKTVVHSPATGRIFEVHLREGDYVKGGTPLYTIADTSTFWLQLDAYEADLVWLAEGQAVEVTLESAPGEVFPGTLEFIEKAVDPVTRTVNVRVVLGNHDDLLKPGMFATVLIHATLGADGRAARPGLAGQYRCYMHPEVHLDAPGDCPICGMAVDLLGPSKGPSASAAQPRILAVARSAVLDTGKRQLVYVMVSPPQWEKRGEKWVEIAPAEFEARQVQLGARAGDWVAVVSGLREGERVVTRGNFLIDSQMELLGKPSLLHATGGSATDPHGGH